MISPSKRSARALALMVPSSVSSRSRGVSGLTRFFPLDSLSRPRDLGLWGCCISERGELLLGEAEGIVLSHCGEVKRKAPPEESSTLHSNAFGRDAFIATPRIREMGCR